MHAQTTFAYECNRYILSRRQHRSNIEVEVHYMDSSMIPDIFKTVASTRTF